MRAPPMRAIECKDDRIKVTINDAVVNEAWGAEEVEGKICLRNQNTGIEFQNLRLVRLDG